jgi:thymidylate synthase (FAD)
MFLVKPYHKVETRLGQPFLKRIEKAGRTCYKSESQITQESAEGFCQKIINRGHLSVIEHESITVRFVIDRGVSHELVRHRLCAFSQESTRYCNYKGGVTFVIPPWCSVAEGEYPTFRTQDGARVGGMAACSEAESAWATALAVAETTYLWLLKTGPAGEKGWSPQQARSVLPNSLKTEIVVTANLREWRHILKLRCAKTAHPQMREVMEPLLAVLKERIPVIFEDITCD